MNALSNVTNDDDLGYTGHVAFAGECCHEASESVSRGSCCQA